MNKYEYPAFGKMFFKCEKKKNIFQSVYKYKTRVKCRR